MSPQCCLSWSLAPLIPPTWCSGAGVSWLAAAASRAFVFSLVSNLDATLYPIGVWGPRSAVFSQLRHFDFLASLFLSEHFG